MASVAKCCTRIYRGFSSVVRDKITIRNGNIHKQPRRYLKTKEGKKADFGFLFDIDGVFVRGKKVLPQARDAIRLLVDEKGKFRHPVLFVTNAGNTLRQNKAEALSGWLDVEVITWSVMDNLKSF
ncbi:hypothetical protein DPMN_005047 [Dreissena polymorpha]|uniref:Uncharacterized protein n=1 Tax=Dreissena polymorpha TaxID=45954 RepID=A0A9D4MSQ8_DREPO|nr:hypothetical protein DPMN_005047 [Dreissena polymorpha]